MKFPVLLILFKIVGGEVYFLYLCSNCMSKTTYCRKCNKTMNILLNNQMFKCIFCKTLVQISQKEIISPEIDPNNTKHFIPISKENLLGFNHNLNSTIPQVVEINTPFVNSFGQIQTQKLINPAFLNSKYIFLTRFLYSE